MWSGERSRHRLIGRRCHPRVRAHSANGKSQRGAIVRAAVPARSRQQGTTQTSLLPQRQRHRRQERALPPEKEQGRARAQGGASPQGSASWWRRCSSRSCCAKRPCVFCCRSTGAWPKGSCKPTTCASSPRCRTAGPGTFIRRPSVATPSTSTIWACGSTAISRTRISSPRPPWAYSATPSCRCPTWTRPTSSPSRWTTCSTWTATSPC